MRVLGDFWDFGTTLALYPTPYTPYPITMKKSSFSNFFLAGCLILAGWFPLNGQETSDTVPLHDLLKDLIVAERLSWKLARQYDPYEGGKVMRVVDSPEQQLTLEALGQFEVTGAPQLKRGKWIVDLNAKTIQLIFLEINQEEVMRPISGPVFKVEQYSDEILVLSRQGRHGWVELHYEVEPEKLSGTEP
jgi:hypothetical protein